LVEQSLTVRLIRVVLPGKVDIHGHDLLRVEPEILRQQLADGEAEIVHAKTSVTVLAPP
jgi:hypothetical protein